MRQWAEAIVGVAIVTLIFYDLFQSVVLPRPSVGKLRLSTFIIRPLWATWRWLANRTSRLARRENWLGTFGPIALILLLAFWGLSIILGYGLILDAVASQIKPPPPDLATSLYFSAGTLLPLSYGDILPVGPVATLAVLGESATGVALIALVISLLFSLYGSFQQREELVVTLTPSRERPPPGSRSWRRPYECRRCCWIPSTTGGGGPLQFSRVISPIRYSCSSGPVTTTKRG